MTRRTLANNQRVSALLLAAACLVHATVSDATTLRLGIIMVDSLEKAQQVLAALQGGADFAGLAKRESLDPAAENGGDLGAIDPGVLHSDFQEALKGVGPGQITGIVKAPSARGFAILKVLDPGEGEGQRENAAVRTMSNAGALPLTGRAVVREPPNTSGLVNVEAAFREMPKPDGWNLDARTICEAHRDAISTVTGRLRALTAPENRVLEPLPPLEQIHARSLAALFESYQGFMAGAIDRFQEAYQIALASLPDGVPILEEVLGSVHFHKAEMENGLYVNADERCLFPPPAGLAKFAKADDSKKAVEYFIKYLERKPDDLEVKWLLNLAYASLGQYPDGVPSRYLVSPAIFKSKESIGRFVDVAPQTGLGGIPFVSGAMLVDDFENDGLLDVVVASYYVCEHVHYFHNNGDGTFTDRSAATGLEAIPGGQGLTQADYDNDGCLDIMLTRGAWQMPMPQALLRNNCDGTFTEVTRAAGLADRLYASQLGVWFDIDNDGFVDLFIGNEQGKSQLFRNRGDGTFENISEAAGVDRSTFVKGAIAEDYDNDGYPDLFISNQVGGDNLLYRNNRDRTFTEVARQAGVSQSWRSFATWFFDYDNDGWLDLFVASDYASVEESMRTYLGLPRNSGPLKLYKNARDGTFEDVTTAVGLDKMFMPMGANYGDVDNDGYLDIYLGTGAPEWGSLVPNVLLRNAAAKAFVDITESSGTGEIHKTHGIAFADLEGKGQKEIVVAMGGAALADAHAIRLFKNPGNDNKWLALRLIGVKTNRAALGARIKVTVKDKKTGTRSVYRTVNSGGSFGSSPLEQQIGLGNAEGFADVEITWPRSGTVQRFGKVAVNQFLEVEELASSYTRKERKRYVLGGSPDRAKAAQSGAGPRRGN